MLGNSIIQPIINNITNNKISFQQLYDGQVIPIKISDDPFVDKKREVEGLLTEFVVNEFFPLASDTEQFIKLVYGTFDNALKLYRQRHGIRENDIFFVYKGGNILRFVGYEIMHELGGKVAEDIEKYYKDAFKKSDADFSIYINPDLPNYDKIFKDMNLLAYLVQDKLRIEFSNNLPKYFAFYRLNTEIRQNKLIEYKNKLNETNTIKDGVFGNGKFSAIILDDKSMGNYQPDPDFSIEFNEKDKKIMERVNLRTGQQNNAMRISSNQTLEFLKGVNIVKFSLVRTKVIFNVVFEPENNKQLNVLMLLGGELIDVSIPHKNDSGIHHYFENVGVPKNADDILKRKRNVSEYKVGDLVFKAPSLTYLIEDLEKILFFDSVFPWDDGKYMKRLRRILFMYYCMLLVNKDLTNDVKIAYLKYIKENIFDKLIAGFGGWSGDNNKEVINNINKFLDSSIKDKTELFPFSILLENLKGLMSKEHDKVKFEEYCKIINENIVILISLLQTMHDQCQKSGISVGDIVEGKALWGGAKNYEAKYLKYKSKYLKLKMGN